MRWRWACWSFVLAAAICATGRCEVEAALPAGEFVDSIGVNTHFAFALDPHCVWHNHSLWTDAVINLGVHHVRDGLIPSYALDPAQADAAYRAALKTLGAHGIGVDLITDPGQQFDNRGTIASTVDALASLRHDYPGAIEAVEGPNEIDNRDWQYQGVNYVKAYPATSPATTGDTAFATGIVRYQRDLYTAIKGDPRTKELIVMGPSEGGTYSNPYSDHKDYSQPVPNGALYAFCDWGNFHPYTFGGNYETQHFGYDTITDWYYGNSQSPGVNVSPASTVGSPAGTRPFVFANYQQPFQQFSGTTVTASRPMTATEKGYFTGTAAKSVSPTTLAKYLPRLFTDDVLYGIKRTYSYELADEGTEPADNEQEAGLLKADGTPKAAYYVLQHLLAILHDPKPNAAKAWLDYSLQVAIPRDYQTANPNYFGIPDTVLHLLLQKSDGTFALLLWNDVASSALTDAQGKTLTSTARDITVPDFPTTITFHSPVNPSLTLYALNPYGTTAAQTLKTSQPTLVNNQVTIDVPDYVVILEFSAAP